MTTTQKFDFLAEKKVMVPMCVSIHLAADIDRSAINRVIPHLTKCHCEAASSPWQSPPYQEEIAAPREKRPWFAAPIMVTYVMN